MTDPSGPTASLHSNLGAISQQLRLSLALAAALATRTSLQHRFPGSLTAQDAEAEGVQDAHAALKAEQQLANELEDKAASEATAWLKKLCKHLNIEHDSLPTDIRQEDIDPLKEQVKPDDWFELAFELVFVSLGLGDLELNTQEKEKQEKDNKFTAKFKSGAKTPPLSDLSYTSLERSLSVLTLKSLGWQQAEAAIAGAEKSIAQSLYFALQQSEQADPTATNSAWAEEAEKQRAAKQQRGKALKWAATGIGFVAGGVAIGLTGGLAAPAIAPLLVGGLGMSVFGGAGGAILIGTLLGLGGGGLASYRVSKRMSGLDKLEFEPVVEEDVPAIPSLMASIVASGYLLQPEDSVEPWRPIVKQAGVDGFAIKADAEVFLNAGKALNSYVRDKLVKMGGMEILKKTALHAVLAGISLPLTVVNTSTMLLDSDFSRCRDKAKVAGFLLAEILEKQVQGKRPVSLLGYGPGATIVFHCLLELHKRSQGSLVYSAVLIALPEGPSAVQWAAARSVVSHEVVNCYSDRDWVGAIAARLYTLTAKVAGLRAVNVEGIRDVEVSDLVGGHLQLREKVGEIMERVRSTEGSSTVATKDKEAAAEKDAQAEEVVV